MRKAGEKGEMRNVGNGGPVHVYGVALPPSSTLSALTAMGATAATVGPAATGASVAR